MPNERSDLTVTLLGEELELTGKVMKNGEIRERVRFPKGLTFHRTRAAKVGSWQEAHYHRGFKELQIVILGRMAVAGEVSTRGLSPWVRVLCPGDIYESVRLAAHNVYLFPETVLATVTHGEPIGNPEKNGNDWWPAHPEFAKWSRDLTESEIERWNGRWR